ncbi:MAG: helix-turn-helix transcriptional regulator [Sneathiellaceae bacterium]
MHPLQFRMARAAVGATVREIAAAVGCSPATIVRFEAGADSRRSTVEGLRAFMTARGVRFVEEPDGLVGVMMRPDMVE